MLDQDINGVLKKTVSFLEKKILVEWLKSISWPNSNSNPQGPLQLSCLSVLLQLTIFISNSSSLSTKSSRIWMTAVGKRCKARNVYAVLKSISMQLMNWINMFRVFLVHESNHLKRIHIKLYSFITILLNTKYINSNKIRRFFFAFFENRYGK